MKVHYLIILLSIGFIFFSSQSNAENQNTTLKITNQYSDETKIIPDVCILYDNKWQEIARTVPELTNCEFNQILNGIYNIEFYQNDFLIGDLSKVNLTEGFAEYTVTTKQYGTLLFVVYYSDQETRFPNVQVDLFSHHNILIDTAITNERGEVVFSKLWPNTKGGHYTAKTYLEGLPLEEKPYLNVDEGFSHSHKIFTKIDRPVEFSIIEPSSPNYQYLLVAFILGVFILIAGLILTLVLKLEKNFWL